MSSYVSADELSSWAELLAPKSIKLQVLQGCLASAEDDASCEAHLASSEALRAARAARYKEHAAWTRQIKFETQFGCGLRLREPGVQPLLRQGDIVYAAPQSKRGGRFSQHGVAVVTNICRVVGFDEGCRTGDVDLVAWDTDKGVLTSVKHEVPESFVSLLPPCCGEGASCPHLHNAMAEW